MIGGGTRMSQWHKFDPKNPGSDLKDHFYYLVTHKGYETPIRAKWHNDIGGHFEVFVTLDVSEYGDNEIIEYWFSWDKDNPILAWMDMPEIYKEE